jgi:hypothetical protein
VPIFRSILHGFGFTVGARAAEEMLDELDREDEAPKPALAPVSDKEAARARAAREKREKKRASEVDKELHALKKRLAREKRG